MFPPWGGAPHKATAAPHPAAFQNKGRTQKAASTPAVVPEAMDVFDFLDSSALASDLDFSQLMPIGQEEHAMQQQIEGYEIYEGLEPLQQKASSKQSYERTRGGSMCFVVDCKVTFEQHERAKYNLPQDAACRDAVCRRLSSLPPCIEWTPQKPDEPGGSIYKDMRMKDRVSDGKNVLPHAMWQSRLCTFHSGLASSATSTDTDTNLMPITFATTATTATTHTSTVWPNTTALSDGISSPTIADNTPTVGAVASTVASAVAIAFPVVLPTAIASPMNAPNINSFACEVASIASPAAATYTSPVREFRPVMSIASPFPPAASPHVLPGPTMVQKVARVSEQLGVGTNLPLIKAIEACNRIVGFIGVGTLAEQVEELTREVVMPGNAMPPPPAPANATPSAVTTPRRADAASFATSAVAAATLAPARDSLALTGFPDFPTNADVGRRVCVYWKSDKQWFSGVLTSIEAGHDDGGDEGDYQVEYDDGDVEWEPLGSRRKFRWESAAEQDTPAISSPTPPPTRKPDKSSHAQTAFGRMQRPESWHYTIVDDSGSARKVTRGSKHFQAEFEGLPCALN